MEFALFVDMMMLEEINAINAKNCLILQQNSKIIYVKFVKKDPKLEKQPIFLLIFLKFSLSFKSGFFLPQ